MVVYPNHFAVLLPHAHTHTHKTHTHMHTFANTQVYIDIMMSRGSEHNIMVS